MGSPRHNNSRELTIYDIAAEAGVSASTVSRVLTNSARVNEDKKIRVLEIIDKYKTQYICKRTDRRQKPHHRYPDG